MLTRLAGPGDLPGMQATCGQALDLEPDAPALPVLLTVAPGRLSLVAETAGEVVGTCIGSLGSRPDQRVRGYLDLIAVAPSSAGRGAGRTLLAAMEDLLRQRGAHEVVIGGHPPVYLWPGVDLRYTVMTCLAGQAGYERYAEAVDLAVDLRAVDLRPDADDARLSEAGITLRRADPAEAGHLASWLRAGPWGESTWPQEAEAAARHTPSGCHVACRDGQYVGFACHGSVRSAWFGPMGTLSSERGRGVGAALLRRCLGDMRAAGLETALIGWAGPVGFYARAVGARAGRAYWLYRKSLGGGDGTDAG